MSFQLLFEDWQGSSIPDRGGKIIPPARNGEWECSGEWFWASLWWYHKASLTSRSQTSGGDVDDYDFYVLIMIYQICLKEIKPIFIVFKAAVRNFFGLKMIRNQYLRKYITSQCSKLLPYGFSGFR